MTETISSGLGNQILRGWLPGVGVSPCSSFSVAFLSIFTLPTQFVTFSLVNAHPDMNRSVPLLSRTRQDLLTAPCSWWRKGRSGRPAGAARSGGPSDPASTEVAPGGLDGARVLGNKLPSLRAASF